jgi:hypothetical protein
MLSGIWNWLEKLMLPCPFRMVFHRDCPGCGLQRSVLYLLKGDLDASLRMYWATIPILILLGFLLLHLAFRFRLGTRVLVWLYCFNAILIVCQFCYKLTHQL